MKPLHSNTDKARRIQSVILSYKGEPVIASADTGHDDKVTLQKIGTKEPVKKISYVDSDLTVKSFSLGYCNFNREALFISRKIQRRYEVGIPLTSLKTTYNRNNYNPVSPSSMSSIFYSTGFKDSLLGIYPSYQECFDKVSSREFISAAFSPNFSLDHYNEGLCLFYNCKFIALFNNKQKVFNFTNQNLNKIFSRSLRGIEGLVIDV